MFEIKSLSNFEKLFLKIIIQENIKQSQISLLK